MKEYLKELFEYNQHSNHVLYEAFISNESIVSEKSLDIFSHILNAHQIWNNRIEPKQLDIGVWEKQNKYEFANIDLRNYKSSIELIDCRDLSEIIYYTNSKGQKFENNIKDILFHIINHSSYHRGQIAMEFRNSGIEPLATDFIIYKR
ncbi:MAG: DinB family protein [Candidatus Kapaibacterium sp.]|jgi:uncharacterized damage-inducible protein DinB|nr:DinB family protein [Candidatus Kapabacteria bacterium]